MKKVYFRVKFLSDIVLHATSNNEGKIEQLDFIPGSNFLGIVAKNYSKFDNPFDVFHSGKVRFGDATVVVNEKVTYKMPLSFFHEKLDKSIIFNHHLIEDFSKFNQLKQKRDNYITKDLDEVIIDYKYSQKSAYDKSKRRSKESSMYGYRAIKRGSIWQFCISYDESIDIEQIKSYLLNKQRLGKSRSAEYGLIEISEGGKEEYIVKESNDYDYLYLKSRVALFDKHNNPTLDVKYITEDLDVVYEKTQIRTSTFTPYTRARETKDYQRVVINRGSVVVVKKLTATQKEKIENGVGAYLSEGFGEIIVNPSFLFVNEFSFNKIDIKKIKNSSNKINNTIKFLEARKESETKLVEMLQKLEKSIEQMKKTYRDISKSQWGRVRAILNSNDETYKDKIIEYISNGVKKWSENQIKEFKKLLNDDREYLMLVVLKLQKETK